MKADSLRHQLNSIPLKHSITTEATCMREGLSLAKTISTGAPKNVVGRGARWVVLGAPVGLPNFPGSVSHTGAPGALAPIFSNFNEIHKNL
jgi:hypothetical protein